MPQATAKAPQATLSLPATTTFGTWAVPVRVPVTQADVDALLDRRNELSNQLSSATGRRNDLGKQLRTARAGPDQTGIETRISQLDGRLGLIESELADVGHALSAAPSGLKQTTTSTSSPRPYGQPSASQMTGITIVGIIFVLAPLAFGVMRIALRRAAVAPAPQIPKEVVDRLERMEQGIDAMAVELERIGEGQRFVTQLMSDRAKRAAIPESVPKT
jgi:hypothetical protein